MKNKCSGIVGNSGFCDCPDNADAMDGYDRCKSCHAITEKAQLEADIEFASYKAHAGYYADIDRRRREKERQ